ncbi:hypothetical protein SAMN05216410_2730 [Sanguibacter gelidistatuariae]|uniref:Uncharacterized protein n=1 Tax=Sanguibacter gelidistatuariae TaxID=1814289 RepID=A0A1G6RMW6_9MICO|nr:hypothetical protein [Sanguibacter gelidistatuariae]SDD06002.1 hypothetical protein SAMN05216410_2730 [Sanguibacter gelidistatuariae]
MTSNTPQPDASTRRRGATPVPTVPDARYHDADQPGMGDVLSGGDASRAPKSLREPERRPKGDAILAGHDWDAPEEI